MNRGWLLLAMLALAPAELRGETIAPTSDIRPIKLERATFPTVAASQALEGWVDVEFTVDTEGKPKDITVVDSSSRVFEPNTVKAIEQFRYEPAFLNGVPVERPFVRFRYVYIFRAEDKNYTQGVDSNRMARFRALARANDAKDDAEVDRLAKEIVKAKTLSIYEHAVLAHMVADRALRLNDSKAAREAIERVPWDVPSIPDNMRQRAWLLLATLNAYENRWAPALYAYGQLKTVGKADTIPAAFRAALDERERRGRVRDPKTWRSQRLEGTLERDCEGSGRVCDRGYTVLLTASNVEAIEVTNASTSVSFLRFECNGRSFSLSIARAAVYLAPVPQERCELWLSGRKGGDYRLNVLFSEE
jgi:TonB family protein